ncbi:MAG: hypothetical protein RBS72_02570 [Sedimentisphaerales bacterium]|jgi:hypothetical protein|nr:hypothetical protein [Sedimentisphaerales bacterium]HNY77273.1 hypothetical protein [Sedimentisphaerales bacterium]HOC62123.1 hypothetical protein [Sedimentisphaerales bacterium]HOH63490.1 hypothetical protein [Sedimentisphaerales bacterium]HPY48381.1 hypothetical protein [Sedimentisphaerales bacterium]
MVKNPKLGKISIVVFLTVLIWVWSDLAQDEPISLSNYVTITVARPSDAALWVSFEGPESALLPTVTIDTVDLKGPASRVTEVDRKRKKGELPLDLFVSPEEEGWTQVGPRTFDVLSFLKDSDEIRQLGLTVESCEPRTLTVQIRPLVERPVPVECVDENGAPLRAVIEPPTVSAYVPDGVVAARVRLSANEQAQARVSPIRKNPYVELTAGQSREIATRVSVTLAREEVVLAEHPVQAVLGYCFSTNTQGTYRVILENEAELATVLVRATNEAWQAYERQPFHILLHVLDSDRQATDVITRPVVFNFPQQYVQNKQIEGTSPPSARFVLELIPDDESIEPSGQ